MTGLASSRHCSCTPRCCPVSGARKTTKLSAPFTTLSSSIEKVPDLLHEESRKLLYLRLFRQLPGLDSNQDKESQNLLCYRYTTGYPFSVVAVSFCLFSAEQGDGQGPFGVGLGGSPRTEPLPSSIGAAGRTSSSTGALARSRNLPSNAGALPVVGTSSSLDTTQAAGGSSRSRKSSGNTAHETA